MKRNFIPISALLTFGIIVAANVQQKNELFDSREIIGLLVVYTMLSAATDLGGAPIASGFALLMLVTIAFARGELALKYISSKVQKPKKPRAKPRAQEGKQNGSLV